MLHPATALVPQITPAADATPKHVEAKPSPSPNNIPENTAKPPVQKVPPARNTAAPSPAINSPSQNNEKSDPGNGVGPGIFTGTTDLNDPKDDSGSSSGETINRTESEATSPTSKEASQVKPATSVGNDDSTENVSPEGDKSSQADPKKQEVPNGDSDPSSQSNPTGAVSPNEADASQQPHPLATVGGEPIVAVFQEASSAENSDNGPGASGGEDYKSPNGNNNDRQSTEISNPLKDPAIIDPQPGYYATSDAPPNHDPAIAPAPFTTTIGRHIIQALSSPNAILVDGETLTRGQSPVVISGTHIALQQNGDLVLGSSTVEILLPYLFPSHTSFGDSPTQAPAPTPHLKSTASAARDSRPAGHRSSLLGRKYKRSPMLQSSLDMRRSARRLR